MLAVAAPNPAGVGEQIRATVLQLGNERSKAILCREPGFRLREAKLEHNFHVDSWQKGLIWIM